MPDLEHPLGPETPAFALFANLYSLVSNVQLSERPVGSAVLAWMRHSMCYLFVL